METMMDDMQIADLLEEAALALDVKDQQIEARDALIKALREKIAMLQQQHEGKITLTAEGMRQAAEAYQAGPQGKTWSAPEFAAAFGETASDERGPTASQRAHDEARDVKWDGVERLKDSASK